MIYFLITLFISSSQAYSTESGHFGKYKGTFVLLESKTNTVKQVNTKLANTRLSPCSTFKVPHSIFGLEVGYIKDKDFTLHFDPNKNPPKKYWPKSWAQDHNLTSAIKNSVVWYFQKVARQIGKKQMKDLFKKAPFGNSDLSGGLDHFWLQSSLKISPVEQVTFWQKLFNYKFTFKKKNVDLLKDLLIEERTKKYVIRAKTGACKQPSGEYGAWWVGSVETRKKTFYFATYILGQNFKKILQDRKTITRAYLKDFNVLQ